VPAADDVATRSRTVAAKFRHPEKTQSYVIPVLGKALQIVAFLDSTKTPLNVSQISDRTGIAKSTVYRILRTLSAYGYLQEG
jgi:DNA-binding MarR family transcriptional regulator